LTAADVGTGLVDFLAVCEVLLQICLLHLFTSWKLSTWAIDSTEVLFTTPLCPACALTFRYGLQFIQCYCVYAVKSAKSGFDLDLYKRLLCSPLHYSQHRSTQSFPPLHPVSTEYSIYLLHYRSCFCVQYFCNPSIQTSAILVYTQVHSSF
jgi:hypothetical protein